MMLNETLLAIGTLLPIVNPLSTAFVYTKLGGHSPARESRLSALTCFITLTLFLIGGNIVLNFFGITIYAFRVAGGIYLAKVAFDMLGRELRNDPENFDEPRKDIAIIPLGIPLLAGPGAMTSVLVMTDLYSTLAIFIAILFVALLSWLVILHSKKITGFLGETGTNVIERILGLIVLVIAVQFVFNGISGYLATI